MTFHLPAKPAILTPQEQEAVWFLGALLTVRTGGDGTGGQLAVLEHQGERGYNSPAHLHLDDDETFLVLEGELRVEVGGQARAAGPGSVAFLPRNLAHAFVVTSPQARFLTLHTPAGFEKFVVEAGTPTRPAEELPPDPAALGAMAAAYGIEIVGPPPSL
ncbi:cupin domain-containing protein [Lentzea sp. NPDC003310]|uniref:cupin domain-containing protein n=1 Tax=Lentzea sp. NPDC003310 TaxID=3154447 RepID=UPI0033B8AE0C